MNCELCDKEFFDDSGVLTKYLFHKIIFHGGDID